MKKIVITLILGAIGLTSFGQISENVIKIHPLNYIYGSLSLGYERALDEKNSIDIGIGIPIEKPFYGELAKAVINDEYTVDESTVSNFHLRAAYRHYTGKQLAPKGFYLEPYLKYQTLKPYLKGWSGDDDGELEGKYSSFVGGFQIGYQFLISKTVTLDWYFLGFEAGIGNIDFTGKSSTNLEKYKQDIENGVDGVPYYGDKIKVETVDDHIEVTAKNMFMPLFRSGFSLGIAF